MSFGLLLVQLPSPGESFWPSRQGTVDVLADGLLLAAFLALLVAFVRLCQRRAIVGCHRGAMVAFGCFLVAAAIGQGFEIWNGWHAHLWPAVAAKIVAGLAALTAAGALMFAGRPVAGRLNAEELEQKNLRLAEQLEQLVRTNASLRASEDVFRAFLDNSPALAWVTDADGIYRHASQTFQRKHQALGPLVGRPVRELFPPALAERYLAEDRQVVERQGSLEFLEGSADGAEFQVFKFPLHAADGRPLVGGIAFDVTEQSRARESLRRQSDLHAAMSEAMRVYLEFGDWVKAYQLLLACALRHSRSSHGFIGVVLGGARLRMLAQDGVDWDVHFGQAFRSLPRVQPSGEAHVEFSRLEAPLDRAVRDGETIGWIPEGDARGQAVGADATAGGFLAIPVLREKQVVGLIGLGGRSGGYEAALQPALENVVRQAGVLCDSYRRALRETALEEQLRVSQKMEAIGMLAGGVAHDFNNLLQVMQGYTSMALDPGVPWAERRAGLEQVRQASERAAQMTQQLLAFSRRQTLQTTDLDLNLAIQELLRMIRRLIGEQITVDFIPGHELGNVRADRGQIDQVLLNLCLNARDALPRGGRITIETENVLVNGAFRESHPWAKPGRYVLVTVSDNGVGMDRETTSRIFEPFFTTKTKDHGTGLGLAVVYGVVKQHEGLVHVYSEVGKGTTFKIYLPIVARSASAVGPKHTPAHPRGTETILLAEDEPMVRELAQRILTRAGYRVLLAADGGEACVLFSKHAQEIALVILDLVMPQLGGREVFERISQLRPGLPVIFCSGYAGSALSADGFGPNGGRLLAKPYGADEMLESVRQALDRR